MGLKNQEKEKDPQLKGTLISVFGIGIFIFLLWFGFYAFYLQR
ncbi:cytochrome C oxidase subunit II [Gottfriedia solisilvae]|uniref:Cytochrome c oxidase subunit 2A n=1 Tax=Gottfriedia solisilvae TaxID=1516104 RepID=A0A8J3F271_9BACI|nr:cytochrome C oxidase subunit II [Gottfriedia solisilvae]GGI17689.1 hypothetical protein GCM10007380_39200 [Gottfriedia solisilvae]